MRLSLWVVPLISTLLAAPAGDGSAPIPQAPEIKGISTLPTGKFARPTIKWLRSLFFPGDMKPQNLTTDGIPAWHASLGNARPVKIATKGYFI
jgi:hypothetical protein